MEKEDNDFNFNKYWGPDDFRPRVVFERDTEMKCVYCGKKADTREHCPSKVFLSKPYPKDLPVVPACKKCNNSFSQDELYVKAFIEIYKNYYYDTPINVSPMRKEVQDAKATFNRCIKTGKIMFDSRIERILVKLSICHFTYELTTGYYSDDWTGVPEYVSYTFRPQMAQEEIESMNDFILMNDKLLPEIGSRVFNRIYVMQPTLISVSDNQIIHTKLIFMDWADIQDNNYRYICWLDKDHSLTAKIVIDEFLFAQIKFKMATN